MKSLKTSMINAQKDADKLKEDYKILQMKNKDMLLKLQNTIKITTSNDVKHSNEKLPAKNGNILNKTNNTLSSKNYFKFEGLLLI